MSGTDSSSLMRSRLAAIVTTFKPDGQFFARFAETIAGCGRFIVVDNTPGGHRFGEGAARDTVVVIQDGQNKGLGKALNLGLEAARRGGFGRLLFDTVVAEARATGAVRMKWQVLDWNEPAIGFYKKLGANIESEWLNGNLDAEQLATYVVAPVATTAAAPETGSSL